MDKEFIKEVIILIKGSDIKQISLEAEGFKIFIETHQKEISQRIETPSL